MGITESDWQRERAIYSSEIYAPLLPKYPSLIYEIFFNLNRPEDREQVTVVLFRKMTRSCHMNPRPEFVTLQHLTVPLDTV